MHFDSFKPTLRVFKTALSNWSSNRATTAGAAMAYYTLFSIAPLVMVSIAVAGWVFGTETSQAAVYRGLRGLLGHDGAASVRGLVESASQNPESSVVASVLGVATLLVGASGVFAQLQDSLNIIWGVKPAPDAGLLQWLRRRVLSFSMVLVIAFLLLVSLIVSAVVSGLGRYLHGALPGGSLFWQSLNFIVGFVLITTLFAAIYKILPDVSVSWRDVRFGATVTSALFSAGRLLIGLYLGRSGLASAYGAAGSLVVIMVWVYYSSCILLLGAELTHAFTLHGGREITLRAGAVWAHEHQTTTTTN